MTDIPSPCLKFLTKRHGHTHDKKWSGEANDWYHDQNDNFSHFNSVGFCK